MAEWFTDRVFLCSLLSGRTPVAHASGSMLPQMESSGRSGAPPYVLNRHIRPHDSPRAIEYHFNVANRGLGAAEGTIIGAGNMLVKNIPWPPAVRNHDFPVFKGQS